MTHAASGAVPITPADDDWHPPSTDDQTWIETCWFPFWLPEQGITVYVRIWATPNAGVEGGAVSAWRGDDEPVFTHGWRTPFDGYVDLRDLRLPNGLSIRCLEPLRRYTITFQHDDCEIDVTFDAVMEPNSVDPAESPGMFLGHLEQPGFVRGRVRFGGDTHAVDCGSVRDRSWGPRVARPGLRIGNAHATTSEHDAFFAYVNPTAEGVEAVTSGYLLQGGIRGEIVAGERTTTWRAGFPTHVALVLEDDRGREVHVDGRCVNRRAVAAQADLYAIVNLVEWHLDGVVGWGENHDVWSREAWLAAGRDPLPS